MTRKPLAELLSLEHFLYSRISPVPRVIKKILQHLGLWEESEPEMNEIIFESILQPGHLKASYIRGADIQPYLRVGRRPLSN